MTLPPLPEPWRKSLDRTKINTTALNPFAGMSQSATPDFYTSAQMQAYATAAVLAERARCIAIVEIGEEPDYESRTCYVCADCLRAALRLLEEPTP